MSEATEESTAVDQPRVRVAEMTALLTKRAPNLCPNIAPRQYKMAASNVLSICATPKHRADAQAFLASKAAEVTHDHEQENEEENEEQVRMDGEKEWETHAVLKTETDFDTRTFRIASAKVTNIVYRTSGAAQLHQHACSSTAAAQQQLFLFGVHMRSLGRFTAMSLLSRHLAYPPFVPKGDRVICALTHAEKFVLLVQHSSTSIPAQRYEFAPSPFHRSSASYQVRYRKLRA